MESVRSVLRSPYPQVMIHRLSPESGVVLPVREKVVRDLCLLVAIPPPTDMDHHGLDSHLIGGDHEMICRLGCMVRMVCPPGRAQLVGWPST
jgi:hypothetical protein